MLNNPLFTVKFNTLTLKTLWEHYKDCLKEHDWTYEYSDDFRVWSNGAYEAAYIGHLRTALEKHDKKRSEKLYEQYNKVG